MNQLMCEDHRYDHLDRRCYGKIPKENLEPKIVFDSRFSGILLICSFKIFCLVNIDEAARRVYGYKEGKLKNISLKLRPGNF